MEEPLNHVFNALLEDDQEQGSVGVSPKSSRAASLAFGSLVGQCGQMQAVYSLVRKVARTDSTVIIYGESGTGKELVARAIHETSDRRDKAFVAINCGAIPENLLESELFGHVRGAFTGATTNKPGKFEMADGGTIFLDEIGDMSPELQVKLLRVLETRSFEPVGGNRSYKVDVRVLAATHRDLRDAIAKGRFREDLFYRLHVIPVTLPPLRERRDDIPLLVEHFVAHFNAAKGMSIAGIRSDALERLVDYHWPGNVRELKNMMERLTILRGQGEIDLSDLPDKFLAMSSAEAKFVPQIEFSEEGICLNTAVTEFEKALILQSLQKTQWVKNKAAKLLHLNRTTLVEKIKRHQLQPCC